METEKMEDLGTYIAGSDRLYIENLIQGGACVLGFKDYKEVLKFIESYKNEVIGAKKFVKKPGVAWTTVAGKPGGFSVVDYVELLNDGGSGYYEVYDGDGWSRHIYMGQRIKSFGDAVESGNKEVSELQELADVLSEIDFEHKSAWRESSGCAYEDERVVILRRGEYFDTVSRVQMRFRMDGWDYEVGVLLK